MSVEALKRPDLLCGPGASFLFHMSLLENIRLGRPEATDQEVLAAAEKAQCGEFLARLPQGIHTMAGDGARCSPAGSGSASPWPVPF